MRALGSGSPQAAQSGGLKHATRAQQPAHTAPSSGRSSTPPQVAQHGASSTASAASASVRNISRRRRRDQDRRRGGIGERQRVGAAPQALEAVEHPRVGGEDVDDEVEVVEQHPFAALVAFDVAGAELAGLERGFHAVGDGLHLPPVLAGAEDEIVGEGAGLTQVEREHVGALLGAHGVDRRQNRRGHPRPLRTPSTPRLRHARHLPLKIVAAAARPGSRPGVEPVPSNVLLDSRRHQTRERVTLRRASADRRRRDRRRGRFHQHDAGAGRRVQGAGRADPAGQIGKRDRPAPARLAPGRVTTTKWAWSSTAG